MKRYAAHYILLSPNKIFKQHYIELDDAGKLVKVAPLVDEIAETSFYNGILFLSTKELDEQTLTGLKIKGSFTDVAGILFHSGIIASENAHHVFVYHLDAGRTHLNLSGLSANSNTPNELVHICRTPIG